MATMQQVLRRLAPASPRPHTCAPLAALLHAQLYPWRHVHTPACSTVPLPLLDSRQASPSGWRACPSQEHCRPQLRRLTVSHSADTDQAVQAPAKPPPSVRPVTKDDVELLFARSSGPGGQNVNKLNTKVDMRLDLDKQEWIPDEVKDEIKRKEKNRINKEGYLVVTAQVHRTQAQNIDEALSRIQGIIDAAVLALTPKEIDPETIKRVKANIKAGQERRLQDKKRDSMRKKERSRRDWD